MKKIIYISLFLFAVFFSSIKNVNAASYIVMDTDNNQIIESSNKDEKYLIASITKIMTAHLVIKYSDDLNKTIKVGDEVNDAHGSSVYLKKGELLTINDLLHALLLRSGNDAAIVLATNISGDVDKFVDLMNEEAKSIGMKNTIFENPTGLDDSGTKNYSTSYDMALLTSHALKNDEFKKIFRTKKYDVKTNFNVHSWVNKNKALFMYDYINGGKTGYTKKAYRTLVTTSNKDNMNLVVVSLKLGDDFNFHVNKHKYVHNNYTKYLIINKMNLDINDKKLCKKCNFYTDKNYHMLLKKNKTDNLLINYELYNLKKYKDNQIVGNINLYKGNKVIYKSPIYVNLYKEEI